MEVKISDLLDAMPDAALDLEENTRASAGRIKELTLNKIHPNTRPTAFRRRRIGSLLLAAVLILVLAGSAYAAGRYRVTVQIRDLSRPLSEQRGDLSYAYDHIGLVISVDGAGECRETFFRANWLPGLPDECERSGLNDWRTHLSDSRTGIGEGARTNDIPYQITVVPFLGKSRLILAGESRIVRGERWGDLNVLEVSTDPTMIDQREYRENYVFLIDEAHGNLISVGGTESLETLEQIARNLEIRVSDELFRCPEGEIPASVSDVCYLNLSRG